MSKKILLVDNELKVINHILKLTDWEIEVLITSKKINKNKRIKKVYSEMDIITNSDLTYLDYKDLNNFWHAQSKIEVCGNRNICDYQINKWTYYRGFALVKRIFAEYIFDLVIVKGPNHGFVFDTLVTDMATYYAINNYNIEETAYRKRTVYNNLKKTLVETDGSSCVDDMLFYDLKGYEDLNHKKSRFDDFIYEKFGNLGIMAINCLKANKIQTNCFGINYIDCVKQYLKLINIKRYLRGITEEINVNKKYICYFIHVEPEASVVGMTDMDSQIAIIQMIASNLPKNWTLYVKEHPNQYKVNSSYIMSSQLYGAAIYKTKKFYDEIKRIKKVRLLNLEIKSEEVIKHCQAMATINGTVLYEAMTLKKPVLVFGKERSIAQYIKDVYIVSSYEECKNAIEKIEKEVPVSYDDYENVCNKFFIDFKDESMGYKKAVEAIKIDIEKQI